MQSIWSFFPVHLFHVHFIISPATRTYMGRREIIFPPHTPKAATTDQNSRREKGSSEHISSSQIHTGSSPCPQPCGKLNTAQNKDMWSRQCPPRSPHTSRHCVLRLLCQQMAIFTKSFLAESSARFLEKTQAVSSLEEPVH